MCIFVVVSIYSISSLVLKVAMLIVTVQVPLVAHILEAVYGTGIISWLATLAPYSHGQPRDLNLIYIVAFRVLELLQLTSSLIAC